jgi:hypothetical protein
VKRILRSGCYRRRGSMTTPAGRARGRRRARPQATMFTSMAPAIARGLPRSLVGGQEQGGLEARHLFDCGDQFLRQPSGFSPLLSTSTTSAYTTKPSQTAIRADRRKIGFRLRHARRHGRRRIPPSYKASWSATARGLTDCPRPDHRRAALLGSTDRSVEIDLPRSLRHGSSLVRKSRSPPGQACEIHPGERGCG